jgi:glycosyltransferase involved in cell wall biosynthesis
MAAGTPTIVCRAIDVVEALKDGETALFVDPLSPEDIAEKISSAVRDPALYRKIAVAGQEFVKRNMSWEKYAAEMLVEFSQ